jgi:excisionase family DNA binding protein
MPALIESEEPYALSPKDAAKRLGIDVSTLYRHYGAAMRRGAIRVHRIGRAVRIIWRSLLDYIEREGDSNGRE